MLSRYGVIYWQETALPLYPISPIEVALHPLGIISHSSCGLEPFIDGILNFERVMKYRIGVVRTLQSRLVRARSIKRYLYPPSRLYLHFQFVNGRGFENWVRLELDKPINVDGKIKLLSLLRLRKKLWPRMTCILTSLWKIVSQ